MPADRYLRTGTVILQIYPGTLGGLYRAMLDAVQASEYVPGEHQVIAYWPGDVSVLQVYEGGQCTFRAVREDES